MNIFIASNEKYIYAAKVMLTSLLVNNPEEGHNIYFMHSAVQPQSIQALNDLVEQHNAKFVPIVINADRYEGFARSERFPIEVYNRFLIPELLPPGETRALWLDVDLLVNGPLHDFYYQDFEDNYYVACADLGDNTEKLKQLDCPAGTTYINSGVILFNIEKMRQYKLKDYLDYFRSYEKYIVWFDQDVLNGLFVGKIKIADYRLYNFQTQFNYHMPRSELKIVREKARIIHYTGFYKPWHKIFINPAAEIWDHYHVMAFGEGALYIGMRRCIRWIIRYTWLPLRKCLVQVFRKNNLIKKLHAMIKK